MMMRDGAVVSCLKKKVTKMLRGQGAIYLVMEDKCDQRLVQVARKRNPPNTRQ